MPNCSSTASEKLAVATATPSFFFLVSEAIMEMKENIDKADYYGKNAKKKIRKFSEKVVNEKMREIYGDVD